MRSDWPVAWMAVATLTPLLTLASVRLSSAQTVQGTVVDAESGVPIYTAEVALLTTDGGAASRVLTDTRGRFVFGVPDSGSFRLRATRFGYVPFTTDAFELAPNQDVVAELRMQVSPVALDSLGAVVEARRPRRLERVGFFKRQAKGFGYFLTPEDIEARRPVHPSDLFWGVPGVRVSYRNAFEWDVVSTRGGCSISVSIDGMFVQAGGGGGSDWQDLLHVNDIEALEVYPSPVGLPAWAGG